MWGPKFFPLKSLFSQKRLTNLRGTLVISHLKKDEGLSPLFPQRGHNPQPVRMVLHSYLDTRCKGSKGVFVTKLSNLLLRKCSYSSFLKKRHVFKSTARVPKVKSIKSHYGNTYIGAGAGLTSLKPWDLVPSARKNTLYTELLDDHSSCQCRGSCIPYSLSL